jgi:hypothetical protein
MTDADAPLPPTWGRSWPWSNREYPRRRRPSKHCSLSRVAVGGRLLPGAGRGTEREGLTIGHASEVRAS